MGEATPYQLKRLVERSVGYFWSVQHAQLYSEPERLAQAGYLHVEREESGRRRKRYSITESGRRALDEWRSQPPAELAEMREPALLKLFFGADRQMLAREQLKAHAARLAEYERIRAADPRRRRPGPAARPRRGHSPRARVDPLLGGRGREHVTGTRVAPERLVSWVAALLETQGTPPAGAGRVARALVDADRCGHRSHGVRQLPYYLELIELR